MTTPPNGNPQPTQPNPSGSSPSSGGSPQFPGQVEAKPMKWLGMTFTGKEAQQLWSVLIKAIGQQISHDQSKAVEAIRKLNPNNQDD